MSPLSRNEMEVLDHLVSGIKHQLSEVAGVLKSRLGETSELAVSAATLHEGMLGFAHRIHKLKTVAGAPAAASVTRDAKGALLK